MDQLRGETSRLRARKESIENVLSHHSYTTETTKRLLGAIERSGKGIKPAGVLADFVEVDPQFERAAEEFLHNELEYVVMKDWADAEAGMQILRTDLEGRATFVVEKANGDSISCRRTETSPGAAHRTPAAFERPHGPGWHAAPRIANCFIAESAGTGAAVRGREPVVVLPPGGRPLLPGLDANRRPQEIVWPAGAQARSPRGDGRAPDQGTRAFDPGQNPGGTQPPRSPNWKPTSTVSVTFSRLTRRTPWRSRPSSGSSTEEHNRAQSRISVARLELERLQREKERSAAQRARNHEAVAQKDNERERARAGA